MLVGGDRLRIDLPDGSVTDFKESLQTRGGLAREPAGVICAWEAYQLHLLYSWVSLADLQPRW